MSPLPTGKKPLPRIASERGPADRVVDLVILLDHLLSTLPGEANGELPGTTRERVDRHRELFKAPYPEGGAVHAAISVRNRIVHSGNGDTPPTTAEAQKAAATLHGAVRAVLPEIDEPLRREVEGGRSFSWVCALLWFLGVWQLVFFATSFVLPQDSAQGFAELIVVLVAIVPLHVYFFPLASRFVPGTRTLFRVASWAWLGALLPITRVALDLLPFGDARRAAEPVFEAVGRGFDFAANWLGGGVWALAPWALPLRDETWSRMEGRGALRFLVVLLPILAWFGWRHLARGPMRRTERHEAGAYPRLGWILAGLAGAFLVLERVFVERG